MPGAGDLIERGLKHHRAGEREQAERLYRAALQKDPGNADALHLLGLLAKEAGDHPRAYELIKQAVKRQPNAALLHNNLGAVLESLERLDEAIRSYESALRIQPGYAEAELNMGNVLLRKGRLEEAVEHYERAVAARPDLAEARNNLGVALRALGRKERAVECFREALRLNPDYADAHINLGALLFAQGEFAEAERAFREALRLRPELPDIRRALIVTIIRQERFAEAEALCRKNLGRQPDDAEAANFLGIALQMQGRFAEAIASYREALKRRPEYAEAHHNLATCYLSRNRLEEAIACAKEALRIHPRYAEAHNTLGHALVRAGWTGDAIASYRLALALKPGWPEALSNLASALIETNRLEQAVQAAREAAAADPKFFPAFSNLGAALYQQGRVEEAVQAFRQALALRPDFAPAHSNLLYCLNYDARWTPAEIFEEHRAWAAIHGRPAPRPGTGGRALRRIGYVSPDFRKHSCAWFIEPVLRAHDREAFEIHLFSSGRPDAATPRFQALACRWHDIRGLTDDEAAELVRRAQIDILVDLAGHTSGNRLPMFARRPAPVAVTWIGYPNTTGLEAIDYRLTDAWCDPPGTTEHLHTETLVRLPRGFLCYQPPANAPEPGPPPVLETGHITFGLFNALPKVRPAVVAAWAAILRRVPGSRLLLKSRALADEETRRRLLEMFAGQGIEEARIEIVGTTSSHARHLAFYSRVDIALDTFPYHGTTTTCEALWMGVPVVVLAGATHVSRVGVSLLEQVGLGELAAGNEAAYVERAAALAGNISKLKEIRAGLRGRMAASPLTDAAGFTRDLEAAYRRMWEERSV
ncbi:MAG TPA: tetratricopeptide repeat protein [Bryobacteraceae bacterium]|nr:tetratricopeptide repeat protein [Bryobacteraceae bacterium]HOQ45206.1 tetratricopeptide repeat protein [Bryobacteraceae bacterium]HPU71278.1 tetratricopeptide repeat protein [Bryobacteraceae bacterium]